MSPWGCWSGSKQPLQRHVQSALRALHAEIEAQDVPATMERGCVTWRGLHQSARSSTEGETYSTALTQRWGHGDPTVEYGAVHVLMRLWHTHGRLALDQAGPQPRRVVFWNLLERPEVVERLHSTLVSNAAQSGLLPHGPPYRYDNDGHRSTQAGPFPMPPIQME
jgi:hypothetical protein